MYSPICIVQCMFNECKLLHVYFCGFNVHLVECTRAVIYYLECAVAAKVYLLFFPVRKNNKRVLPLFNRI